MLEFLGKTQDTKQEDSEPGCGSMATMSLRLDVSARQMRASACRKKRPAVVNAPEGHENVSYREVGPPKDQQALCIIERVA